MTDLFWTIAVTAAVVALLVVEAGVLLLVLTTPLTFGAAVTGVRLGRGGIVRRLGWPARVLLAMPAAGTLLGLVLHAHLGSGSWWDFAGAAAIYGALAAAYPLSRRFFARWDEPEPREGRG